MSKMVPPLGHTSLGPTGGIWNECHGVAQVHLQSVLGEVINSFCCTHYFARLLCRSGGSRSWVSLVMGRDAAFDDEKSSKTSASYVFLSPDSAPGELP
jgi:hypothetical protein